MSIESTVTIKRSDAIRILEEKLVLNRLTNERLEEMLYLNRDSIFENYNVVHDTQSIDYEWE